MMYGFALRVLVVGCALLCGLLALSGCGGHSSTPPPLEGGVRMRLHWSAQAAEFPGPYGMRVEIRSVTDAFPVMQRWIPQPDGASVTTLTLLGIPAGEVEVTLTLYPTVDESAATVFLATGSSRLVIQAGIAVAATVTMTPTGGGVIVVID